MILRERLFHLVPYVALLISTTALLNGCAAIPAVAAIANAASGMVGFKKGPEKPPEVKLALYGGSNLNASGNVPMALVVKIYYLKGSDSFNQTPMTAFVDGAAEKQALGQQLITVREVTLTPDQHYESVEKMPPDASNIGVVALFHSPAPERWKFIFDTKKAVDTGIFIGIQACAMTIAKGQMILPPGEVPFDPSRLSSVICPQ
jgi:type VI secretion system protein VasD